MLTNWLLKWKSLWFLDFRPSADAYDQAASNLVAGSNIESTVQQLLEMGGGNWDRDTVLRALRAAYNNPERAVDYLYSVMFFPIHCEDVVVMLYEFARLLFFFPFLRAFRHLRKLPFQ